MALEGEPGARRVIQTTVKEYECFNQWNNLEYPNRVKANEITTIKEPITRPPAKDKKSRVRWLALRS
jgi:hypothetical protein